MKTLFKNALICYRDIEDYKTIKGYLGVDKDTIVYLAEKEPTDKYDVIKDMSGKLLFAGLVNAHGHSPMTLLRGVGSGKPLKEWLFNSIFPIEDKLTPNDIYVGCKLAILEMLASGTTQFSEMYDFPFASMKAIAESGIKANVCRVGLAFDPNEEMDKHIRFNEIKAIAELLNNEAKDNAELVRELGVEELPNDIKEDIKIGNIKYDFCLHSEYLTSEKFAKAIATLNKKYNLCLNTHVSETKKEVEECIAKRSVSPVKYFEDMGLLDNGKCYMAHCVHVNDEDLAIMKKHNVTLVHNPSSNMKLGSGLAPIAKAIKMGINTAIGTDGCASNNNLNMFEEMHIAALLQTGMNQDASLMQTKDILDMATINGAKALSRNDTGILKVGFKADIIAIDLSKPHLYPILDIPSLLVYSVQASDVSLTMVDGKILYENGKYFTLDYDQIINDAEKIIRRLY